MTTACKRPPLQMTHPRRSQRRTRQDNRPVVRSCTLAERVRLNEDIARHFRVLEALDAAGDLFGMASCYLELGDLYLARGDVDRANELYRFSLEVSRSIGHNEPMLPL